MERLSKLAKTKHQGEYCVSDIPLFLDKECLSIYASNLVL